ncbi:MAG: hypothetical protein ACJATT_005191 [Myxococcota bacterium]|jgi:hypothetical protein
MSKNSQSNGRTHARHPRPSHHASRPKDEQVLAALPYRKGHLTDQELVLFGELRGELSPEEKGEVARVAPTLRQPLKRLRALDLIRYWGTPLTNEQHRMLPWFAGLAWQRPLPRKTGLASVPLAHHLLCSHDVPAFLMEPFAHPCRYRSDALHWELCRLLATLGKGGGLTELRGLKNFWTWVPQDVFERFSGTPPDTPVMEGLIDAFVQSWEGPEWLAKQASTWMTLWSFSFDVPQVLRVVHGLCVEPLPEEQTRAVAESRLAALPRLSTNFGHTRKLPIPNVMPTGLEDWTSHELRTPDDFEAEELRNRTRVTYRFQEAQRGQLSYWSLQRGDQCITVKVNVSRMRAWQIAPYSRPEDPEEERVLSLWALANGMRV